MLSPKRVKYRKPHRVSLRNPSLRHSLVSFGDYGLRSIKSVWLTSRQIEAGRRSLTRYVRRGGKLWIRIFPDKAVTARPAETRIGSGKGVLEYWVAVVHRGIILFELRGVPENIARQAVRITASKLPTEVQFVVKY
jgi:large subunit ribosomal protein L16